MLLYNCLITYWPASSKNVPRNREFRDTTPPFTPRWLRSNHHSHDKCHTMLAVSEAGESAPQAKGGHRGFVSIKRLLGWHNICLLSSLKELPGRSYA